MQLKEIEYSDDDVLNASQAKLYSEAVVVQCTQISKATAAEKLMKAAPVDSKMMRAMRPLSAP